MKNRNPALAHSNSSLITNDLIDILLFTTYFIFYKKTCQYSSYTLMLYHSLCVSRVSGIQIGQPKENRI